MKDPKLEDALTSVTAQLHSVQNRLMQVACRGAMSAGIAAEVVMQLRDSADRLEQLARRGR